MPFVGAAAVLEPEHVTVGAAPMPAAPKKSSVATNCFSLSERWAGPHRALHAMGHAIEFVSFFGGTEVLWWVTLELFGGPRPEANHKIVHHTFPV